MFSMALWLCALLLIGSAAASDVPFVFSDGSSGIAGYNSAQIEKESTSSPDLAGIPPVISAADNANLEFLIVGSGNAPNCTTEKKVADLKETLNARVEATNPTVIDKAALLAAKFPGAQTIEQICSIYKYMRDGWHYVSDPRGVDYYRYANESIYLGKDSECAGVGDCDDFAILMSAFVESIGGTTRIILAQNKSIGGHAYTEVYLGNLNDKDGMPYQIIRWLENKYNENKIYTHINTETGDIWMNLDWSADHPGGAFFTAEKHIAILVRGQYNKAPLSLPEDIDVLINRGSELASQGKYEDALQYFDSAINLKPKNALAWYVRGLAREYLKRYEEAIEDYDKTIVLMPSFYVAWRSKGDSLSYIGKYEEAIRCYDRAIELAPRNAESWSNQAAAFNSLGRYDEALYASERAIELKPNYVEAYNNKGNALDDLSKYNEAIQAYDKAIELDPQLAFTWNNKGSPLGKQGKYDEAIQCFDKAIELNPNYAEPWNNKGIDLGNQGNFGEAILCFDKAIEINPQYANAWYNKGIALKLLGKTSESNAAISKARELGHNG